MMQVRVRKEAFFLASMRIMYEGVVIEQEMGVAWVWYNIKLELLDKTSQSLSG